jgi:hypothetical protein
MANAEHLAILKQGVDVWKRWRKENREIAPDLSQADLRGADLIRADLSMANLHNAKLIHANLHETDLHNANLQQAILVGADLSSTDLSATNLYGADLSEANLSGVNLMRANLSGVNLTSANLSGATLIQVNLYKTDLNAADFEEVRCGYTLFSELDLSQAKNLHRVGHWFPSTIGLDTLIKSKGKIPIEFLVGAGVPIHVIENMQYIVDIPTIQYYSSFISYSTKNEDFAQQLNDRMKREGLRVWFAPEEIKGGQKVHEQLYEAIRYHDKLILVLSEASMNSNWVQSEIRRARKHEREDKRRKLFPISLVPFAEIQKWELFDADEGRDLAQEIREYYIPDFSQWKNYDKFNTEFDKLLKALKTEE